MAFLFKEIEKGLKTVGKVAGTAVKEVGKGTGSVVGGIVSIVDKNAGKTVKNSITKASNTVGGITETVVGTGGTTGMAISAAGDIFSGKPPKFSGLGGLIGGGSFSPANLNPLQSIQGIVPDILRQSEDPLTDQAIQTVLGSSPTQPQNLQPQQINNQQLLLLQQQQQQEQQQLMMYVGGFILLLLLLRRR